MAAHPFLDAGEYEALQAAAGWRAAFELIGGQAVVTPPTGGHASSVQGELHYALRRWQETAADSGLVLQDVFLRLLGGHYLAPDVAWWAAERRPPLVSGALDVVPDLVIEVLSPATRINDLGPKPQIYLAAGVRELWLVDPETAEVTVTGPAGSQGVGDRLASPLLPHFEIELDRLFASR